MSKPTLVFDLDGTIADTRLDLIPVLNRIVAPEGLGPVTPEEVGHIVGHGAKAMIRLVFERAERPVAEERLDALLAEYIADYQENLAVHTRFFEGFHDTLDRFEEAEWTLAVCTNKLEHLARRFLAETGILGRFSAVTGGDTFEYRKPHGGHILKTVEQAGGDPRRAIMIGDSITDISAARDAGVPVIAVTFGYSTEPVATLGPDAVISHFDELWDAVHLLGTKDDTGFRQS